MGSLQDRVTGANIRWHCRSVIRRWADDNTPAPFGTEFIVVTAEDDQPDGVSVALSVKTSDKGDGRDHPTVRVRGAVQVVDDQMVSLQDCEVRFHLGNDSSAPAEHELRDMLTGWGAEYLFGYLRGAVADSARSVGLAAPVLPTMAYMNLDEQQIDALIVGAWERTDGEVDTL
ncbi:hypothetical protein ABLE92_07710 [Gordonia sp. VNQ95]|jgi:hypothetical protein|uniref:hypothetical protein n=1 Tax=Gordonia TaxID=2053 RepID=UPI0032B5F35D